jgi:hypothetical protein
MDDVVPQLSDQDMAELCALADGTLPADRRAAVEARVAASPELQAFLDRQRRAVAATRMLAHEPAPASLQAAVHALKTPRMRRRLGLRLAPRLALVGALAVVLAVAAALLTGGPGAPTIAEAAELGTRPPTGPPPAPLGDRSAGLALDMQGVVFPNLLNSYGWRAMGVRRDELDGRHTTTVFYEKGGKRIAYVIVAGAGLSRPSDAPAATRNGVFLQTIHVEGRLAVTWRRLGHTCVLVGSAGRDELLSLASWRSDPILRY